MFSILEGRAALIKHRAYGENMANDTKDPSTSNKQPEKRRGSRRKEPDRREMVRWEPRKLDRRIEPGRRTTDRVWGNPKFKR